MIVLALVLYALAIYVFFKFARNPRTDLLFIALFIAIEGTAAAMSV